MEDANEDANAIVNAIEDSDERAILQTWIEYRKEIRKPYKSPKGINALIAQLREYSNGDTSRMRQIIQISMANQWQGIFPPRDDKKQQPRFGRQEVSRDEIRENMKKTMEILNADPTRG